MEALNKALSAGDSANWVDWDSDTSALHFVVGCDCGMAGEQYALVRALVAAGAVATASTSDGESVLERALLLGSEPTVELLLEAGATPHRLATTGVSMLALARIVGNAGAARVLRLHAAKLLASDEAAIEQWGGIGGFIQSLNDWTDNNLDATGDEYLAAFTGYMRHYLGHRPEVAEMLDLFEQDPTAFQSVRRPAGTGR